MVILDANVYSVHILNIINILPGRVWTLHTRGSGQVHLETDTDDGQQERNLEEVAYE